MARLVLKMKRVFFYICLFNPSITDYELYSLGYYFLHAQNELVILHRRAVLIVIQNFTTITLYKRVLKK